MEAIIRYFYYLHGTMTLAQRKMGVQPHINLPFRHD